MEHYILHRGRMPRVSEFRTTEYNDPDIMP